MRWKLVVLPAPFGPISATVSPSRTEKLRPCTARRPPKRLLRLVTTSASAIGARPLAFRCGRHDAPPGIGEQADQPGRPPQDHGHEDEAVDGELHAAARAAEPALQQCGGRLQQYGAEHRPP